jgi:DNA-binding CsgD family transcriptional regulator
VLLGSYRPRTAEAPTFTQVAPARIRSIITPQRLIGHRPPPAAMADHVAGPANAPRNARSSAADEVRHIAGCRLPSRALTGGWEARAGHLSGVGRGGSGGRGPGGVSRTRKAVALGAVAGPWSGADVYDGACLGTASSRRRAVEWMPVPSKAAPLLLGRERDVAQLEDALALAMEGEPQVVVLGGDAGVGKTTLIASVTRRAEAQGFSVGLGHGLDIEAGIAFGPVIEALVMILARSEDVDSRPLARRMRAVLDPAKNDVERGDLLEDLRLTVLEAAACGPVLLVLEDMHWADESTRDLAVALSRTARGRLMFVVSVRSEDLPRGHPARKALAEMGRVSGGRRVELGPLDRAGIAGIVASVSGGPPDPALVGSLLERSEGNPLYAEEILAAGSGVAPTQLSDLFLTRIDALPEGPRELVRMASVDGTRVDIDALADVMEVDQVRLDEFLRALLDANVLRHEGDSLVFRHGLLREAVYDDLLPDERTRDHVRFASALQARADAHPTPGMETLSRLAFHWSSGHDLPRALHSSVRAGLAAMELNAVEQIGHFQRALSLWDQVPDPEDAAGQTRIELTLLLGQAAMQQQDLDAWYRHTRRAVDMLESTTDRLLASRAYAALGACAFFVRDPLGPAEAIRLAVEYAGDAPTAERAWALVGLAQLHLRNDRFAAGLQGANAAVAAARAADSTDPLIWGMNCRNVALAYLGHLTEACAGAEDLISLARSAGRSGAANNRASWLASTLMESGQVDRGMSLARATHDAALAAGLQVSAADCGEAVVTGLTWQGRFDEAETLLEELRERGLSEGRWRRVRGALSLALGDIESATLVMPSTASVAESGDRHPEEDEVLLELQIAALCHDGHRCLEVARSYLGLVEGCDSPLVAASAARIGFQALDVAGTASGDESAVLSGQATRHAQAARGGLTDQWHRSLAGVQLLLAEGYAARVARQDGSEQFREASALAEPYGAYVALAARLEVAQELLAHGSRDEGRELLVTCWTAAHGMGARGIEQRALRLATRSRVPLPPSAATHAGPLSRLTPREREVLDLLSTGATNKAIASALVISEKTASVHVSNVLAKLGVPNRGAAAALARDLIQ